jgi:hypothetical protein
MVAWDRAAAIGLALLAAGPALAKQTELTPAAKPASMVSGVTVNAPEKSNSLVDKTAQFVRQRLPVSRNEQYARFRDAICVRVIGLPQGFDAFVAKRIVELAKEVHAPVDPKATCTPNINVIFSTQPQAQLTEISRRREVLFGFFWRSRIKDIATFKRPIQSWYLTRTVGTDGLGVLELAPVWSYDPDAGKSPPVTGRAGSRLGNDMSSELVHSLIIADTNQVAGLKIDAVADYVAVLALSRWRGVEKCNELPTILNLMADGCQADDRPEAATPGDVALLTGLYSSDPRESGDMQRATIASAMRKSGEPH